jgi:hypothetical protein
VDALDPSAPEADAANTPRNASLIANFHNAQLRLTSAQADFQIARGENAKKVRYFVLPPLPLPTQLLGQPIPEFVVTDFEARRLSSNQWRGKILVLAWYHDHPASRPALTALEQLRSQYADDSRISFVALCTEPTTSLSSSQVAALLKNWKVTLMAVRDLDAVGRDLFRISEAPTTAVLGGDGTLQWLGVGGHADLTADLAAAIEGLLAGRDVAQETLRRHAQQRDDYQRNVELAGVDGTTKPTPVLEAKLAEPSEPRKLKLTELWSNSAIEAPGNMLVIGKGQDTRLFVIDGWREVVELSTRGEVAKRYPLDIPPDAAVAVLRGGADGQGRRYFAGAARGGKQLFVFDQDWKLICTYPGKESEHPGIQDLCLADLDGDGEIEIYAGFAGPAGTHRISLAGQRQWSHRAIQGVLAVAAARSRHSPASLLVAGEEGLIGRVEPNGQSHRKIAVGHRGIHHITSNPADEGRPTPYCGLSYNGDGSLVAVGLDPNFLEVWSYPLPAALYRHQVDFPISVQLLDDAGFQWLLAGADGSIHVVSDDAEFSDHFNFGQHLAGLAAARLADRSILLVATVNRLSALQIQPLQPPEPTQP